MTATRLSARVWLVGTSEQGPAFTDDYDGNQYLVWDGSDGILIDAGGGRGAAAWLDNVAGVADPGRLAGVLITHHHADHAGGAAAAAEAGLEVFASATSADAIARGDEQLTQLARARVAGVYPADFTVDPAPEVRPLSEATLALGGITLNAIDAPGHCDGHVVYALDEEDGVALFTGDAVFPGGRVSMQAIPDCRLDLYAETVQRLAGLGACAMYPGHGGADLDPASVTDGLGAAAASFARLVPPPNLLS